MKSGRAEASKSFQRKDLIDCIVATEWMNVNLKEEDSTLWIAKWNLSINFNIQKILSQEINPIYNKQMLTVKNGPIV